MTYRPDIDGLRGVAILGVVLYHAAPSWLPGGFVGVDVFFVISGFLITGLVRDALDRGTFRFRDFYARRIRRLFPALAVVLVTSLAVGWYVLSQPAFEQLGATAAAASAFVPNLALWRQAGYFDAEAASKPLLHLWSLGVEEQFYLVWPLFLVLGRRSRWPFVPVVGSALALSFVSGAVLLARDPSAGFYWPQARAWELLVGALLAGSTGDVPGSSFTLTRHGLSAAGLVVVVGSMLLLRKRSTKAVLTAS